MTILNAYLYELFNLKQTLFPDLGFYAWTQTFKEQQELVLNLKPTVVTSKKLSREFLETIREALTTLVKDLFSESFFHNILSSEEYLIFFVESSLVEYEISFKFFLPGKDYWFITSSLEKVLILFLILGIVDNYKLESDWRSFLTAFPQYKELFKETASFCERKILTQGLAKYFFFIPESKSHRDSSGSPIVINRIDLAFNKKKIELSCWRFIKRSKPNDFSLEKNLSSLVSTFTGNLPLIITISELGFNFPLDSFFTFEEHLVKYPTKR